MNPLREGGIKRFEAGRVAVGLLLLLAAAAASAQSRIEDSSTDAPSDPVAGESGDVPADEQAASQETFDTTTAQEQEEQSPGGSRLHAGFELAGTYTDNFYYSFRDRRQQEAGGLLFRPNARYVSRSPRLLFVGSADASLGMFDLPGELDDYEDYGGSADIAWDVAPGHNFGYEANVRRDHDEFGRDRTEVPQQTQTRRSNESLDEWIGETYRLKYRFTSLAGGFSLHTSAGTGAKEYRTNRNFTRYLDRDSEFGRVTYFYHYSPKTSALIDLIGTHTTFDRSFTRDGGITFFPRRDNTEYRARLGLRWLATARTTGDIRLGYLDRNFEDGRYRDFRAFDWEATLSWAPRSYRLFALETSRKSQDSYDDASFIDIRRVEARWTENWTPRLSSTLLLAHSRHDYVGAVIPRKDGVNEGDVLVEYRLRPKITLFSKYEFRLRDSDDGVFEYNRNTVFAGVRATLF